MNPSAQAPPAGYDAYMLLFNKTYAANKPPVMQSLYAGQPWGNYPDSPTPTQAQRWAICAAANAQGYAYDEEIDGLGWDPFSVMAQRELYGNTWVPSGLGDVASTTESPVSYTGAVPPGQLKVSTLLSDFPPFPVPAPGVPIPPPPIPTADDPVGVRIQAQVPMQQNFVGDIFRCAVANDGYPEGATWTGTSGAFTGTWQKTGLELNMLIVWVKTQ